jgi:type IV pilus assembly protein PilM
MFFSQTKSIVGVDIGTSYIKIAQVTHNRDKTKSLDTYGIVNVSGQIGTSQESGIKETANILANLLKKANVSTRRCVASLPNSAVFTSVIDMPKMSDKDLASAMQFEAKKYVPLPFAEVKIDWAIISEVPETNSLKVMLIAVPNQVKDNYQAVFKKAGLELEVIEIEALAIIRSLIVDTNKNNVIIDIGAKATGLNVVKNGLLQLTRNLNIGGDTITERIAESLNISFSRAEQFKKEFGVNGNNFLPDTIKPVLNVIKAEVKQLINIYQSHSVGIDNILLIGGGSQLPGTTDYFKDLGSTVSLGNALAQVSYPQAIEPLLIRARAQLPVAIGLALRTEN